jgi:hypothetical protein
MSRPEISVSQAKANSSDGSQRGADVAQTVPTKNTIGLRREECELSTFLDLPRFLAASYSTLGACES